MFVFFKTPDIVEICENYNSENHTKKVKDLIKYIKKSYKLNYSKIMDFVKKAKNNFTESEQKKIINLLIKKYTYISQQEKFFVLSCIYEINPQYLTINKLKKIVFNDDNVKTLKQIYTNYKRSIDENNELTQIFWTLFLFENDKEFILQNLNKDIIENNKEIFLNYFKSLKLHNKTKEEINNYLKEIYEKHKKLFYKITNQYNKKCKDEIYFKYFYYEYLNSFLSHEKISNHAFFDIEIENVYKPYDNDCLKENERNFRWYFLNEYKKLLEDDIKKIFNEPIKYDIYILKFYVQKLKNTPLEKQALELLKEKFKDIQLKFFTSDLDLEGNETSLYNTIDLINKMYELDNDLINIIKPLINKIDNNLNKILNAKTGWIHVLIKEDKDILTFVDVIENYFKNVKKEIPPYFIAYLLKNKSVSNELNIKIRNIVEEYLSNKQFSQISKLTEKLLYDFLFIKFFKVLTKEQINNYLLYVINNLSVNKSLLIFEQFASYYKLKELLPKFDTNIFKKMLNKTLDINNENIYRILFLYLIYSIYKNFNNNSVNYENTLKSFGVSFDRDKPKKFINYLKKLLKEKKSNLVLYSLLYYEGIYNSNAIPTILQIAFEAMKESNINLDEIFNDFEKYLYIFDLITLEKFAEIYLNKKDYEKVKKIISIIEKIDHNNSFVKKAKNIIQNQENILKLIKQNINFDKINTLTGVEFEELIATKFNNLGFKAYITPKSRDYGADIIVECKDKKIAIQCKRFKNKVNLKAVQEVSSALSYYNADYGIVITNNEFLDSAINLAKSNNIELWSSSELLKFLNDDLSFSNVFNSCNKKLN